MQFESIPIYEVRLVSAHLRRDTAQLAVHGTFRDFTVLNSCAGVPDLHHFLCDLHARCLQQLKSAAFRNTDMMTSGCPAPEGNSSGLLCKLKWASALLFPQVHN